ncbi:MAG: TetR family transcriptional regulator C-terminal domain-containing protein [Halioglobus sp.]
MPKIVDHEQQRQSISATVARVVAERGLENTTLRNVASHHGCTKGMVQHYFADKEELLLAALVYIEECCAIRMAGPGQHHTGLELLQARLSAQLPLKPEIVDEWQVRLAFNHRAAISEEMREALSTRLAEQEKQGLSLLRAARKSGEIKKQLNLRNSYRSLNALVQGLGVDAVMNPGALQPTAQRQILKRAIDELRS